MIDDMSKNFQCHTEPSETIEKVKRNVENR